MLSYLRRLLPVAALGVLAILFVAGCEECPEGVPEGGQGNAAIEGIVHDAISGAGVDGAHLQAGDAETNTDTSGYFLLSGVEAGDVSLEISADGYVTGNFDLELAEAETLWQDFTILPLSTTDEYRIVLTWGLNPDDLDSHLWIPDGSGYWHVYYGWDGYLDQPPYAQLDTDDTSSYGPETITIRKHEIEGALSMDYYQGEYIYAIHHYSGESDIPNSGAQVRVYSGNTLIQTINAPSGTAYDDWFWYVGRLNCRTGQWTLVNTYSANPPVPYMRGAEK